MTNTTTHGQVPALYQYTSDLASKCQGVARCLSYNASAHEAQAKHTLLEASHALDAHSIRVHRKRDGLREKLIDLIAETLSGTYHCTRVWAAWGVGTMSQDDFEDVGESDTPAELADAILALLAAAPTTQTAPVAQGDAEDAARWRTFISLPYSIRSEWASNLSIATILTQWVDQAAIDAARAQAKKGGK